MNQQGKKKILIVLPNSGGGGDTQCLLNLLYATPDANFSFYFLVNQAGILHARFQAHGQVFDFPLDRQPLLRRILRRLSIPLYSWCKTLYFQFVIKRISPDLIFINTVNCTESVTSVLNLDYQYVIYPHEFDFVVTHRINSKWLAGVLKRAKLVICPAKAVSDFYHDIFDLDYQKVALLHATVSDEHLESKPDWSLRKLLKLPNDTIIVGMSGSLIYRKGADLFIRTAEILSKETSRKIVFVWMGGSLSDSTEDVGLRALWHMVEERSLQEQCLFIPYQTSVKGFFKDIDIFLLPSRIEAFPLVLLEAMLFEKPVVATDVGGIGELVDSETGYLVKDKTPEGLAEGIHHFINAPNVGKQTGLNGRKRVVEHFEAKVQSKKWIDILNSI